MSLFRPGVRVRELAAPGRAGTVRQVRGIGRNARIIVGLDHWYLVSFTPGQLVLL